MTLCCRRAKEARTQPRTGSPTLCESTAARELFSEAAGDHQLCLKQLAWERRGEAEVEAGGAVEGHEVASRPRSGSIWHECSIIEVSRAHTSESAA